MLRNSIERVLKEYLLAKQQAFTGHELASFLRHDFPRSLSELAVNVGNYKFDGSAGRTKWTDCPWVATFDTLITESAQSGYYPVYLFREDMKGVYLSLNQGMTALKEKHGIRAKGILSSNATQFRAYIEPIPTRFKNTSIDLAIKTSNERAAFYEAGNICARYYSADNLPPEGEFIADYREVLRLYGLIRFNEDRQKALSQKEPDEQDIPKTVEDLTKFKVHKRVERNAKLSQKVKQIHGYTCQACGFTFQSRYGELGKGFIEAHHLKPISELKGKIVELDPRSDFSVLCSNCHSMIHRFEKPEDIEAFRKILRF